MTDELKAQARVALDRVAAEPFLLVFHPKLDAALATISPLLAALEKAEAERDRQYDENVNRIRQQVRGDGRGCAGAGGGDAMTPTARAILDAYLLGLKCGVMTWTDAARIAAEIEVSK